MARVQHRRRFRNQTPCSAHSVHTKQPEFNIIQLATSLVCLQKANQTNEARPPTKSVERQQRLQKTDDGLECTMQSHAKTTKQTTFVCLLRGNSIKQRNRKVRVNAVKS